MQRHPRNTSHRVSVANLFNSCSALPLMRRETDGIARHFCSCEIEEFYNIIIPRNHPCTL